MPCADPQIGWGSRYVNPTTGKRATVFNKRDSFEDGLIVRTMPCGQCIFCRLAKSRNWAQRATHEASLYERNCFITLTYAPEHLPPYGFLDYNAPVLFMKRLREKYPHKIRAFGCAEYGEKYLRPHYHLCIFNHDFDDKKETKNGHSHSDHQLFTSDHLSALWPYGFSTIGSLTFESAAYVARYCTKKITGKRAQAAYETICPTTGEIFQRPPERAICLPRRPGLGGEWYDKYGQYIRNHDFTIIDHRKMRPAPFYDKRTELADPEKFAIIKAIRKSSGIEAAAKLEAEDCANKAFNLSSKLRRHVMEEILLKNASLLVRNIEK